MAAMVSALPSLRLASAQQAPGVSASSTAEATLPHASGGGTCPSCKDHCNKRDGHKRIAWSHALSSVQTPFVSASCFGALSCRECTWASTPISRSLPAQLIPDEFFDDPQAGMTRAKLHFLSSALCLVLPPLDNSMVLLGQTVAQAFLYVRNCWFQGIRATPRKLRPRRLAS